MFIGQTSSAVNWWLVAVAALTIISLIAYVIPVFRGWSRFDLNKLVPIFFECGGIVASVKMMVIAFRIGDLVKNNPGEDIYDAASIFIGGMVFLCASSYGLIYTIAQGYVGDAQSGSRKH